MGFISWLKNLASGRRGDQSIGVPSLDSDDLPSLILPLSEAIGADETFVADAVRAAFGVDLSTEETDSGEFVAGTFPVFFVQFAGKLLQIKFVPQPYTHPDCKPFLTFNPDEVYTTLEEDAPAIQAIVDNHEGWIQITFMNPPSSFSRDDPDDPWAVVATMTSAFAVFDEVTAIVCPSTLLIRRWDLELLDLLSNNDITALFIPNAEKEHDGI